MNSLTTTNPRARGIQVYRFTEPQLEYMRWLAMPAELRVEKTEAALAAKWNIPEEYFRQWKRRKGWDKTYRLVSLQVLLDFEPELRKASIVNMLKPEGWQERIAYYRYVQPGLIQAEEQGLLDSVSRDQQEEHTTKPTTEEVREQLANEPPEVREKVLEYLRYLDRVQAEQTIVVGDGNNAGPSPDTHRVDYIIPDWEREAAGRERSERNNVRLNRNGPNGKRERKGIGPSEIDSSQAQD